MKTNKQNELLRILSDATQSIPSAALARMLGVSERTIRNYVRDLNDSGEASILASREGYRLQSVLCSREAAQSENEGRVWHILSDLLTCKDGVNAFDEAEQLFISASTVIKSRMWSGSMIFPLNRRTTSFI